MAHAIRFRTTGLLIIAAVIELFVGLSLYTFPREYRSPLLDGLRPYFGYLSTALMAGGVILLVLARYPLRPWVQRVLVFLPAVPLTAMAALSIGAPMKNAPVSYLILAAAVLAAPWLPTEREGPWRLSLLTLAAMEIIRSLRVLSDPGNYIDPVHSPIDNGAWLMSLIELLCGFAVLLVKPGQRGKRAAALLGLGMIFPVIAAFTAWSVGMGTGVIIWGTFAAVLAASLWRVLGGSPALFSQPEPPKAMGDSPAQTERLLELWTWVLVLMILVVSLLREGSIASPVIMNLFVIVVSAYNAIVHLLFPKVGTHDQRVLVHLGFLSVAVSFLLTDGGRWAFVLSALMVIPPFLAARVRGAIAGYWMMGLGLGSVILFQLIHWRVVGHHLAYALSEAAVQILVIATAGVVGIRSAAQQHQLVSQLAGARSDLQQQVQRQALLSHIGQSIRSSLDLDEILTTTVNELGRALQVSRCFIRLRGRQGFLPVIHQYMAPGIFPLNENHLPHLQLSQVVYEARQIVVIDDILRNPIWKEIGPVGGTRAAIAAPIWADEKLLGVITFHQCDTPRTWTPEEIQFLETVAVQVAVAMAHAQAHQHLAQQHAELQAANRELTEQGSLLISQARQLEEALLAARTAEEGQARLVTMMEATVDYIGITDRNGSVLYLNQAARDKLGVAHETDPQLSVDQVFAPEFAARLREAMRAALRTGTWSGEGVVLDAAGQEIPVSLVILVHRDPRGEVFFGTIARDITMQKMAQEALRDSEERFRSAFGFAPIGMGLLGPDGHWAQVNHPLCDMLGFSEEELVTMNALQLLHTDDVETTTQYLKQMLRGEIHSYQAEQRWFHRFGHVVWTQVAVSVVNTANNRSIYYVVHVQDITERKQVESQLLHLANFDPLTDLLNRRRFQEELERQLANSARYGTHGALLFIDLDQFKYINDSLGHQAGDQMLRSLAKLLRSLLRETDSIARLGGDEFAVLLPNADARQAEAVAHKLLDALRRHVEIIGGRPIGITGSMGIALFPDHGRTAEELLAYADMAMYRVKEVGRNNFTLYTPDETERLQLESKLTWERRIRDALEHGGFMLYQQPILDFATGTILRHEGLLRMKGSKGEVIMPGTFLPVAERFGLIHAIDRWVVREAIRQIALSQERVPGFCLEVNLSGKAFADPELLPLIKRELEATGINPAWLVLEITETAACTDTVAGRAFVTTLREMGCRFALDDFGTGFSSFSYLKHLPVDYLKIDGSFIRNLARDPVDQELVRAMVQVARGLGRKTIAECVEDQDTLVLLQRLGVDYAQGYYIGRPVPIAGASPVA